MIHLSVMVGKFVKQDAREFCPSTTAPLLSTMADSLLASGREVPYDNIYTLVSLTLLRTPNGVSTEHTCSDRIF